ncbi:hypothetical protein V8C86DRAFT_2877872 [Haematococcus lacustris]
MPPDEPGQHHTRSLVSVEPAPTSLSGSNPETNHTGLEHGGKAKVDDSVECRICLTSDRQEDIVQPCECHGSVQYVHLSCLTTWALEKRTTLCELCKTTYIEPYGQQLQTQIDALPRVPAWDMSSPAADQEGRTPMSTWRAFWCHIVVLLVLLGAILYLTVFSNFTTSGALWTVVLWRVLAVLIPAYLITRVLLVMVAKWRQERALQREHERAALDVEAAQPLPPPSSTTLPSAPLSAEEAASMGRETAADSRASHASGQVEVVTEGAGVSTLATGPRS